MPSLGTWAQVVLRRQTPGGEDGERPPEKAEGTEGVPPHWGVFTTTCSPGTVSSMCTGAMFLWPSLPPSGLVAEGTQPPLGRARSRSWSAGKGSSLPLLTYLQIYLSRL